MSDELPEEEPPARRSLRLQGFDYRTAGTYFVTICAHGRQMLFEDEELAALARAMWNDLPSHFTNVGPDAFVVMPNHVHGIVWIRSDQATVGAQHAAPLRSGPHVLPGSLGAMVRSFKSAVTREARLQELHNASPVWQRNYYDRIIRNDDELNRIREYIAASPSMWNHDPENPLRVAEPSYDEAWSWLEAP